MADYGNSDTSTTSLGTNQFPISEVYVPSGTQTAAAGGQLTALEGGPASTDSASPAKRSAPASMYMKDGSDVTQGTTTDVAVTGDNPGTHSAKLRGLLKIFADVWDGVNHCLKVDPSDRWARQVGQVDIARVLGAAMSASNPLLQETTTQNLIRNGKAFAATTGTIGAAATGWCALSLFNPNASGKTLYVTLAQFEVDSAQWSDLYWATTDPNFNGTNKGSITPVNLSLGNATISVANVTYSRTGAETETGTKINTQTNNGGQIISFPDRPLVAAIPPNNGLVIYVHVNAVSFIANFEWSEL